MEQDKKNLAAAMAEDPEYWAESYIKLQQIADALLETLQQYQKQDESRKNQILH